MKRRHFYWAVGLPLVVTVSACNLFRMLEAPAEETAVPQQSLVPALVVTTSSQATNPANQRDEPPSASTDSPPHTATPDATITSGRRDEAFDGYVLTTYTETTRYPVTGSTAEELDAAMALNGPRDDVSGSAWFALTVPLFDWDWGCGCDDGGCHARDVTISLSLSYSLPVWHYDNAPPDLLAKWTEFEQALTTHERGHGDLAHACAMSLGERVSAMSGAESCESVDQQGLAEINDALALCRAEQRDYEDTTNHGTSEGVVWPP